MSVGVFSAPHRLWSMVRPVLTESDQDLSAEPPNTHPSTDGDLGISTVLECGSVVMACQFNSEGTLLAVGLINGTIQVYKVGDASPVYTLRDSLSVQSALPVTALRFTHSSSHCLLLATYASGVVRSWYVSGGQCLWLVKEEGWGEDESPRRQTLSLSLSPSSERVVTAGTDCRLHLYDLQTHQRVQTCTASSAMSVMDGHLSRVFAVTFHPEKETEFISGGWDNTVQFWDSRLPHAVRSTAVTGWDRITSWPEAANQTC
ncbi:WD repeat-containing protein 38 isoform X3 [Amia ocellicauda]|uniref:WD repeat-containing protein 38 isoform X3 n=1 Tax=Amia ocellicauda TaxID=2972642 RepID=UPI003464C7BE